MVGGVPEMLPAQLSIAVVWSSCFTRTPLEPQFVTSARAAQAESKIRPARPRRRALTALLEVPSTRPPLSGWRSASARLDPGSLQICRVQMLPWKTVQPVTSPNVLHLVDTHPLPTGPFGHKVAILAAMNWQASGAPPRWLALGRSRRRRA